MSRTTRSRTHRPGRSTTLRWGGVVAVSLTVSVTVAGAPAAAGAAAATAAPGDRPARGEAYLGSTLAAHEPAGERAPGAAATLPPGLDGLDVSSHQGDVDWASVYADKGRFAWVKATEGTYYTNPYFTQQYDGSATAGLLHGAYHFAVPDSSSGTAQADFFVDHGGTWTSDGRTMPPMLDIEYDPYGSDVCYGLTPAQMVSWTRDFVREVRARTTRTPIIFTTAGWWDKCTGSNTTFRWSPLFISHWNTTLGPLPAGWTSYEFWQYSPKGRFPGQMDRFPGWLPALKKWATSGS